MSLFICRHANERKVKGIEFEDLNNIEENNDEFENIPSDNESDEGNSFRKLCRKSYDEILRNVYKML